MPGNVVWMEGFDIYNGTSGTIGYGSRYVQNGSGSTSDFPLVGGRFGGQAINMNETLSSSRFMTSVDPWSPLSSLSLGMAVNFNWGNLAGAAYAQVHLKNGAAFQMGFRFENTGAISIVRCTSGTAGTVVATSDDNVVPANAWCYMEAEIVISSTVGRVTIWINGTQVANFTDLNIANSGTTVDRFMFHAPQTGSTSSLSLDDIYVTDTAEHAGEYKIETIRPNADSTPLQLTPSTGATHYNLVGATLAQVTNYVEGQAAGLEDLYDLAPLSSTPESVKAIQIGTAAWKTDAGTKKLETSVDYGSGIFYNTPFSLSSTPALQASRTVLDNRPGGGEWTATDIDNLKVGVRINL